MAVVSLKIGGRFYKFSCNDGQEMHMRELAETLDQKAGSLTKAIGFMQEGQLLAMMCLLLAEEKHNLERSSISMETQQTTEQLAQSIQNLAFKVGVLAESLEQ